MGIKNRGTVLWKANGVTTSQFVDIGVETRRSKATNTSSNNIKMDFDILNLTHIIYQSRKTINSEMVIKEVAQYLKRFAYETGFIVTAVIDGDCRPQSKQDSFARRYAAYINKINGYYCRQSAIAFSKREYLTEEQASMLDELNKEAGKLDHRSVIINPDFCSKL